MRRIAVLFALAAGLLPAQGVEYIKARYTKYEYSVPMRDGKKLFTVVYAPKDRSTAYPVLFLRTPYSVGPYGADNYPSHLGPSELFAKEGYIFVYQDVRGRWRSEGEFVNVRPHLAAKRAAEVDESTDTWDTIEWLVKHVPNNNGRVGMWGISYPGFYVAEGMIDAHPALKAASPQAPIADWFVGDDFHHNGTLYLAHAFGFFYGFGRPRPEPTEEEPPLARPTRNPDGYNFFLDLGTLANLNEKVLKNEIPFWNEMTRHPDYDDFWQARNLRPHLKNIRPAVMTVGGWFDAEDLFGALNTYRSVEAGSPKAFNVLVMGPWVHGGWARGDGTKLGPVAFNAKTSEFYRANIELPFFNYYLKSKGEPKLPEAYVFETGTNQWMRYDAWPPKDASPKTLYFRAGGGLSYQPPADAGAFDEYVSDPARPAPYIAGISLGMTQEHMVEDQRFAATRPDVLVYRGEPLAADTTVAGPLTATLYVSTTGTDSDWVVKLIDVYPENYPDPQPNPAGIHMGGYQQLVRGEAFRGKYRNGFSHPEPFEPGKPVKVEFTLPDVCHTFRTGHRLMVQVQSAWFPLVDRNPQVFTDIYHATPTDFRKATQRVYRTPEMPSGVKVMVR